VLHLVLSCYRLRHYRQEREQEATPHSTFDAAQKSGRLIQKNPRWDPLVSSRSVRIDFEPVQKSDARAPTPPISLREAAAPL
jgi:hypothetical protein